MIDLIDALREILEEPGSTVAIDDSCALPAEIKPNTLYAFPVSNRIESIGTGEVGGTHELREDFSIRAVFAVPNPGEEAGQVRERDVSVLLDAKGEQYLAAIMAHAQTPPWDNLTASVDHDFLRQFEIRGVSIVATGYRLRSS